MKVCKKCGHDGSFGPIYKNDCCACQTPKSMFKSSMKQLFALCEQEDAAKKKTSNPEHDKGMRS